jgi:phage baseplate assembly protein gpV
VRSRGPKLLGVWPGIVTDNSEGAGNPGYRVKVKLPWLSEQETTCWARIAVPMGGSDRGTYMLPEIDDQVLVVFEHGDIGRPIVVGTLWSKRQEPVEVNQSGKNNTKLIRSRSGHRIIFDDKAGAEKITIVDKTMKNKIVLDSVNKLVKIESDGDIAVIAKANVIMHANALEVGAKEGVTGKAKSLLTHAQKTFGLRATGTITLGGGSSTINVSSSPAARVSGTGSGELGGAAAEAPKDQIEDEHGSGAGTAGHGGGHAAAATAASSQAGGEDETIEPDMIEVRLLDASDALVGRALAYELTLPDGSRLGGQTDGHGILKLTALRQRGSCTLVLPELEDARKYA